MITSVSGCIALATLVAVAGGADAQAQLDARDTLRLGALHDSALRHDPRRRQLDLLSAQAGLRLRNIAMEQRPTVALESYAQYQSDVPRFPVALPGGATPTTPPHDTYDARLSATLRLYDPSLSPRRDVERAQLAESSARVHTALYATRLQVTDAFFAALRAQAQLEVLRTTIAALDAQRRVAATRVREGSALRSEEDDIRAELLQREQAVVEWNANRRASLDVLADLTGVALDTGTVLQLPDLAGDVARARALLERGPLRARPEYEQFARSREQLAAQEQLRRAQDKPRMSAFGRVGYGQPGLNPLNDSFDSYWLAGVQLQWTPVAWGTTRRDREVLALQRQIVATEEDAFADRVRQSLTQAVATIDRLESALVADDSVIALRERIAEETRRRFVEAAVTSAEYVERQSQLANARVTQAMHRVELAQARAHLLATLGLEVR